VYKDNKNAAALSHIDILMCI